MITNTCTCKPVGPVAYVLDVSNGIRIHSMQCRLLHGRAHCSRAIPSEFPAPLQCQSGLLPGVLQLPNTPQYRCHFGYCSLNTLLHIPMSIHNVNLTDVKWYACVHWLVKTFVPTAVGQVELHPCRSKHTSCNKFCRRSHATVQMDLQ